MKEIIKRWLGIEWNYKLRDDVIKLTADNKNLSNKIDEMERQKQWTNMYVKGMMNYLDLEFTQEVIPHPSYIQEKPPTMPILVATKRKKSPLTHRKIK